jgi:hypothetical protein
LSFAIVVSIVLPILVEDDPEGESRQAKEIRQIAHGFLSSISFWDAKRLFGFLPLKH